MLEKTIEKLEKEMMDLDYQLKKVIPKEILKARELGDLSENAEYHAAKERQRLTETRISHIQGRIRDLKNIDLSK
ncbi:MAG: transcription elongation factor GreA, partial [Nitrospinota bacterium]